MAQDQWVHLLVKEMRLETNYSDCLERTMLTKVIPTWAWRMFLNFIGFIHLINYKN